MGMDEGLTVNVTAVMVCTTSTIVSLCYATAQVVCINVFLPISCGYQNTFMVSQAIIRSYRDL